jgi:hypothetical protein
MPPWSFGTPLAGRIDAHDRYPLFDAFLKHLLRRLPADTDKNLRITQDNKVVSLPGSANVNSGYCAL